MRMAAMRCRVARHLEEIVSSPPRKNGVLEGTFMSTNVRLIRFPRGYSHGVRLAKLLLNKFKVLNR